MSTTKIRSHYPTWIPSSLKQLGIVLLMPSLFGAVPYSLKDGHIRKVSWKVAYNILAAFLPLLLTVYSFAFPLKYFNVSSFSVFIYIFQALVFSLTTIVCMISLNFHSKLIDTTFHKLIRIEKMMSHQNLIPKIKYNPLLSVCGILASVGIALADILVTKLHISHPMVHLLRQFTYIHIIAFLEPMTFFLQCICHYLDEIELRSYSNEAVLEHLCSIHDRLADVCSHVRKVFSFPVLGIILTCFFSMNANIFLFIRVRSPVFIGLILFAAYIVILIAHSCGNTTRKGNEFYLILYKLMKRDSSHRLMDNEILNAHMTKKNTFVFNAGGFFDLDYRFVGGMVTAIVTYTIILLQIKEKF